MARNTLSAVFGALGAGLTGYGRDVARRREEEQARLDRERQAERDRLADEVTVAGLLERGFGGEQEQRAQGQQRSRTALQMALQGATAGRGGMAPSMPMPTQVQQLAAQQARPQRTPVNVAGRQLSLLETALERAQRQRAEGMEEASLARQQELADEARRNEQRMREIAAQGENQMRAIERTASLRPLPTTATGGIRDRLPALPTAIRTAEELRRMQPEDIKRLRPYAVYSAAQAPLLAAEAKDPFTALLAGGGNVLANAREQTYAQYVGAVSDAVARLSEVGVLTNQDIARFRAQTLFVPGDSDEMKTRKYENLKSWADYIIAARSAMTGQPSAEETTALREQAQQIGTMDERDLFRSWARENPRQGNEDDADYVARFRQSLGVARRGGQ